VPTTPASSSGWDSTDRRGVAALVVALALIVLAVTAGIVRGPESSAASGAATWVARERPAGVVLTVDGWGPTVADDDRLRVVTAAEDDLGRLARETDVGSLVAPSDATVVDELRATGEWTVTYRDGEATVLVADGALPVDGAP
jgi:hypothetical protein